jgi:hypothetical protein
LVYQPGVTPWSRVTTFINSSRRNHLRRETAPAEAGVARCKRIINRPPTVLDRSASYDDSVTVNDAAVPTTVYVPVPKPWQTSAALPEAKLVMNGLPPKSMFWVESDLFVMLKE